MKLKIMPLRNTSRIPQFKTEGSVGMDFYVSLEGMKPNTQGLHYDEFVLLPGQVAAIPLGVAVELEPGYQLKIHARSSITLEGISVVKLDPGFSGFIGYDDDDKAGIIDSDYRGEVHAILMNHGRRPFIFKSGQRVCQGIITRVECPANGLDIEVVSELSETARNDKKFGHSGNN